LEGAYISLKDPNVKYAGDKPFDQDEQERQNEQEMNRVSDYRHRLNNLRNHIRVPNRTYQEKVLDSNIRSIKSIRSPANERDY
jgi:hypothetical protein